MCSFHVSLVDKGGDGCRANHVGFANEPAYFVDIVEVMRLEFKNQRSLTGLMKVRRVSFAGGDDQQRSRHTFLNATARKALCDGTANYEAERAPIMRVGSQPQARLMDCGSEIEATGSDLLTPYGADNGNGPGA